MLFDEGPFHNTPMSPDQVLGNLIYSGYLFADIKQLTAFLLSFFAVQLFSSYNMHNQAMMHAFLFNESTADF